MQQLQYTFMWFSQSEIVKLSEHTTVVTFVVVYMLPTSLTYHEPDASVRIYSTSLKLSQQPPPAASYDSQSSRSCLTSRASQHTTSEFYFLVKKPFTATTLPAWYYCLVHEHAIQHILFGVVSRNRLDLIEPRRRLCLGRVYKKENRSRLSRLPLFSHAFICFSFLRFHSPILLHELLFFSLSLSVQLYAKRQLLWCWFWWD